MVRLNHYLDTSSFLYYWNRYLVKDIYNYYQNIDSLHNEKLFQEIFIIIKKGSNSIEEWETQYNGQKILLTHNVFSKYYS